MSAAHLPDAACLSRHVEAFMRDGVPHVRIEHALVAAFGTVPRQTLATAFRRAADRLWREQHAELCAEPLADKT